MQQHDAESFVRELLHEAPAPMERELDKAREMAAVPERDIADDILAQRNEETGEALAGRTLARALEQDDTAAVREAAGKLEGRAFTPQMQSLMKQADICVSAPGKEALRRRRRCPRSRDIHGVPSLRRGLRAVRNRR